MISETPCPISSCRSHHSILSVLTIQTIWKRWV